MRQLEFLFTEDGAQQRYLEHQLADMRSKWLQSPEPRLPLRLYRSVYVAEGYAKQFSDVWREEYFGSVVETQTEEALKKWHSQSIYK